MNDITETETGKFARKCGTKNEEKHGCNEKTRKRTPQKSLNMIA
jgi:hypothetical protein